MLKHTFSIYLLHAVQHTFFIRFPTQRYCYKSLLVYGLLLLSRKGTDGDDFHAGYPTPFVPDKLFAFPAPHSAVRTGGCLSQNRWLQITCRLILISS